MNMNTAKRVGMFLSIFAICSSINAGSYVPAKVLSNHQSGTIVSLAGTLAAVPYIVKQIDHNKFDGFSLQQMICGFAIAAAAAIPVGVCVNQLSPEKQHKRSEAVINLLNEHKIMKSKKEFGTIIEKMKKDNNMNNSGEFEQFIVNFCGESRPYNILALYHDVSYLAASYSKEEERLKQLETFESGKMQEEAKNNADLMHKVRVCIESLDCYNKAEKSAHIRSKRNWINYLGAVAAILTSPWLISGVQTIFNKFGISIDLSDLLPQPVQVELTILQR